MDAESGAIEPVVGSQTGREAWGLWYHKNKIFVAGGGPSFGAGIPEIYVYDVATGESIAACAPLSISDLGAFMNDVTVVDGVAYATDSVNGELMAFDVDKAVDGICDVWAVDLPDNFNPVVQDDFGANGVIAYAEGLLVSHEIDGSVWYISDLEGGQAPTFQEVIPDGQAEFADGLTIADDKLYVTRNFADLVAVYQLTFDNDIVGASFLLNIESPLFATPATSAIYDGYIYSANALFASVEDIATPADDTVVAVSLGALAGGSMGGTGMSKLSKSKKGMMSMGRMNSKKTRRRGLSANNHSGLGNDRVFRGS